MPFLVYLWVGLNTIAIQTVWKTWPLITNLLSAQQLCQIMSKDALTYVK